MKGIDLYSKAISDVVDRSQMEVKNRLIKMNEVGDMHPDLQKVFENDVPDDVDIEATIEAIKQAVRQKEYEEFLWVICNFSPGEARIARENYLAMLEHGIDL